MIKPSSVEGGGGDGQSRHCTYLSFSQWLIQSRCNVVSFIPLFPLHWRLNQSVNVRWCTGTVHTVLKREKRSWRIERERERKDTFYHGLLPIFQVPSNLRLSASDRLGRLCWIEKKCCLLVFVFFSNYKFSTRRFTLKALCAQNITPLSSCTFLPHVPH